MLDASWQTYNEIPTEIYNSIIELPALERIHELTNGVAEALQRLSNLKVCIAALKEHYVDH